jgi:hypothetical protein
MKRETRNAAGIQTFHHNKWGFGVTKTTTNGDRSVCVCHGKFALSFQNGENFMDLINN